MSIRPSIAIGCIAALPLFWTGAACAQDSDGLTVKGQVRARVEALDGQFRPGAADDDAVLLLQTDIAAEYRKSGLRIGGEVIDSRGYFEDHDSSIGTSEVNAIEPVQAYIGADITDTLSATAGRFTMALGNGRLIARNNFRNTTNAFTGARIDWKRGGASATAFWTMPQRRLPSDDDGIRDADVELDKEGGAQQFFGGYLALPLNKRDTVELYSLRLVEQDAPDFATRNRHLVTTGARFIRTPAPGNADTEIEAAWQTGTTRVSTSATDTDDIGVTAWLLHAEAGWTFTGAWRPRVAVLFDYGSGDKAGGRYGRFDSLFGARVKDFGPTSFYGPVSRSNIISPAVRVEVAPNQRWDANATARFLRLASATDSFASTGVRDTSGASGRNAGAQFDARIRYWVVPKRARLAFGAAWLSKGSFLTSAPNAPATGDTHYGYAEMTISF
ncbi:alginate export family protein [Stakelama sp. CBK3Z-3]|uniref:Alginate export family protein n=1 Tax=Stakelama flava TaxID=2860338 RepID=A0ABS6XJG2_9SPHN|nr:alginate export family protein [Stakelama flava]MBW4330335.1 alginate export family protein [Stakelama flava]